MRAVAGLPDGEDQRAPVVTPDELTIYWTTTVGSSGDVFVATRQDTKSPFSGIHAVASVNTTARSEGPTFISADGCRLYYASSVHPYPSPDLLSDIFVATKHESTLRCGPAPLLLTVFRSPSASSTSETSFDYDL